MDMINNSMLIYIYIIPSVLYLILSPENLQGWYNDVMIDDLYLLLKFTVPK